MALCTGKWRDSDQHPSQLPLFPSSEPNFSNNHVSRVRKYSHIFQALRGLLQPVPTDEVVVDFCILDASIRGLPSGHNLPHGHPKRPLEENSTQNKWTDRSLLAGLGFSMLRLCWLMSSEQQWCKDCPNSSYKTEMTHQMLLMLTHHLRRQLKALPSPILQWSRRRFGSYSCLPPADLSYLYSLRYVISVFWFPARSRFLGLTNQFLHSFNQILSF